MAIAGAQIYFTSDFYEYEMAQSRLVISFSIISGAIGIAVIVICLVAALVSLVIPIKACKIVAVVAVGVVSAMAFANFVGSGVTGFFIYDDGFKTLFDSYSKMFDQVSFEQEVCCRNNSLIFFNTNIRINSTDVVVMIHQVFFAVVIWYLLIAVRHVRISSSCHCHTFLELEELFHCVLV